ncbi:MAG TPA: DUF1329 domain-containing protein [Noviherbaspirillum sp.]|uniref:DUF1329 domain-containing protein n=1 Tax=Noviherbaspirillum sp. TaxID=1926288 RepID=UPI002B47324C|nr:DUF1329 domain-containing protein [Noviherbaspirillum sp.]HJV86580.1 DUF1329 domain-containing protein [Noviherbaspirillum sp.]
MISMMKSTSIAVLLGAAGLAHAQLTSAELKQLGTTLTPWGAEVAGNADGTIPAYTGGLTTPPANYDKSNPGWRPDPFPNDKPLFKIDASNVDKYKDKLSVGTIEMIKKYPTFHVEVFQTRRTAAYPKSVQENSIKNATRCKVINDGEGLDTSTGCGHGIAFPIPKSGIEAMWSFGTRYRTPAYLLKNVAGLFVKPNGEIVKTYEGQGYRGWDFYDPAQSKPDRYYSYSYEYSAPTRLANNSSIVFDDVKTGERVAYNYSPATRRVRLAPDNSGDTPVSQMGGAMTFDEDAMFAGKKDRYDWKLMGKKEMYIPYNNYRFQYPAANGECAGEKRFTPFHLNPKCVRWELHRVWHVRGTLKEGKRHIFKQRDMYIDEDSWGDGLSDHFDQNGRLFHINQQIGAPLYDAPAPAATDNMIIDMISGVYGFSGAMGGVYVIEPWARSRFAPDLIVNKKIVFK